MQKLVQLLPTHQLTIAWMNSIRLFNEPWVGTDISNGRNEDVKRELLPATIFQY